MDIILQTIRSDYFRQEFLKAVHDIRKRRHDARIKSNSGRLKSHPFGILDDHDDLTYESMSKEYLLILMRKSTQPSVIRSWISDFMTMLFYQTLEYVRKEKELIAEPTIPEITAVKIRKPKVVKPKN